MKRSWRDVVGDLAGADAQLTESIADDSPSAATTTQDWATPEPYPIGGWPPSGWVVAELAIPGVALRIPGPTSEDAWHSLAHALGDFRLLQALDQAGWEIVDEVIDETTYVVARDPSGTLWAIGVASADGNRRGELNLDIGFDDRTFGRIAFVEPLDTRDAATLLAALGVDHGSDLA